MFDNDNEFTPPPDGPEYELEDTQFKTYFTKRAQLFESVGLAIFDPQQTQWKRDIDHQKAEALLAFGQCVKQIHREALSASDFAIKITEFMVADRLERTRYIARLKTELIAVTFVTSELHEALLMLYHQTQNQYLLFSKIDHYFYDALDTDIDRAIEID